MKAHGVRAQERGVCSRAFRVALPYSLPVCVGFLFMAMSYGFMMRSRGFPIIYPIVMSCFIYAGAMEFVTAELLLAQFDPVRAFLMTLMINARHLFYGISMLDRYRGTGAKKFYLIYGMCDETFAINWSVTPPADVDRGWFMFFVTLLNQIYWVLGAALGALIGSVISFNTNGIDFVMTALFVVMLVDHWEKNKDHRPVAVGAACALVCLVIRGADRFMIPAMALMIAVLTLMRDKKTEVAL